WHCVTANHRPPLSGNGSAASTRKEPSLLLQSRQRGSSQSTTTRSVLAPNPQAKNPMLTCPPAATRAGWAYSHTRKKGQAQTERRIRSTGGSPVCNQKQASRLCYETAVRRFGRLAED